MGGKWFHIWTRLVKVFELLIVALFELTPLLLMTAEW